MANLLTLASLCGADLIVEWERRLDDFERRGWYNRVKLTRPCTVEYLGLVNREGTDEDRVVVRITAAMEDWVETKSGATMFHEGKSSAATTLEEYWTLAQRDGRWYLLSIEQDPEGEHNLHDPLITLPEEDTARMHDEAVVAFRSRHVEVGLFQAELIVGVMEVLDALVAHGYHRTFTELIAGEETRRPSR